MDYRHEKKSVSHVFAIPIPLLEEAQFLGVVTFQSTMNLRQDTPPKWSKAIMMWWTQELTTPKGHSMYIYNIYLVSSEFVLISTVFSGLEDFHVFL